MNSIISIRSFLSFYFIILFITVLNSSAQVSIGSDPTDETSANKTLKNEVDLNKAKGELSYEFKKEDREKALVILKKVYPQKSFKDLNELLGSYMQAGFIQVSEKEKLELSEVMSKEPDESFFTIFTNKTFFGGKDEKGESSLFAGIDQIRAAFEKNPLSLVSKDQVKETLLKQWEDKWIGQYLKESPKALEFLARFLTDKEAVPKLLDITKKKNELKYFSILVVLAQVMLLLAFFTLFKGQPLLVKFFKRFCLTLAVNAILIIYFMWRFDTEVSPLTRIISDVFF